MKVLGKIPSNLVIALSGGIDSVVVADFVSRSRKIECAFFNHGTETSNTAQKFVVNLCEERNWTLHIGHVTSQKSKHDSYEEFWRDQRYAWLDSLNKTVILAHHLDDCIETYIWSSLHGTPKLVPYRRNNAIRPFLLTPKSEIRSWASNNNIQWVEDHSNMDTTYTRNYIRQNLVPHALHVNPGLHKVIAKNVRKQFQESVPNEDPRLT